MDRHRVCGRGRCRPLTLGCVRAWLARQEPGTLAAAIVAAAGLLAFAVLAGEVAEGDTRAFDEGVLLMFRSPSDLSKPLGPVWLQEMITRDFTALGSTGVLALFTLSVVGFLALTSKRQAAGIVVVVATGVLLSQALKWGFARDPRPGLVPHGPVHGQSFPSGHAMMSAVVYLTLGALLARAQARRGIGLYLMALSVVATVLVGASRVYLGVHWPTDVLAGWAGGAGWALLCWLTMVRLQRRAVLIRRRCRAGSARQSRVKPTHHQGRPPVAEQSTAGTRLFTVVVVLARGPASGQRLIGIAQAVLAPGYDAMACAGGTAVFVVFALPEIPALRGQIRRRLHGNERHELLATVPEIAGKVRSYLWTMTASLTTSVASCLFALALGLDLALVRGTLNPILLVGNIAGAVPPVLYASVQFQGWQLPLAAFVGYVTLQLAISSSVEPLLQGRSLSLSPLVVLVALLF